MSEDRPQIRRNIKRTVIRIGNETVTFDQEEMTEISPSDDITSISSTESLTVNGDRVFANDIRGQCEICEKLLIDVTFVRCVCTKVICTRCARIYDEIPYCPNCFRSVRLRGILLSTGRVIASPFRKGVKE